MYKTNYMEGAYSKRQFEENIKKENIISVLEEEENQILGI